MQLEHDPHDRTTVYADLRDDEPLTPALRERAITRARALGATHIEFWGPPYGKAESQMAGFRERVLVPSADPASVGMEGHQGPTSTRSAVGC
jgi:hypothetical protein